MGLLNVIKLANDYNKAKKVLEGKKADIEKIKTLIEKTKEFIEYIRGIQLRLSNHLAEIQSVLERLKGLVKEGK